MSEILRRVDNGDGSFEIIPDDPAYPEEEWSQIRGWRHHRWLMTISDDPADDPPRHHDPVVIMQDTVAILILAGWAVLLGLLCFILSLLS